LTEALALRANSGNSWAIGSAFYSAWELALKILWAMFPSVSHGAMIEVMLQAGGQLVKSTISLPTPTFAHMVSLAFHAIGMEK